MELLRTVRASGPLQGLGGSELRNRDEPKVLRARQGEEDLENIVEN